MHQYNSTIAREVLSEAEKDRLLAVALSTSADNSTINWEKASTEFGAASVDSMRVSVRNIYKKLDKAGAGANADGAAATPGPSKATKRKTADTEDGEPKAKKPRASKKKASKTEDGEETVVKDEAEEEEE
ncbi:hypothetical protein BST61_g6038 [Cercospora zeina]